MGKNIEQVTIGKKGVSIDDELIININDFINNYSRVPLAYSDDGRPTIPDLLSLSANKYKEINEGTKYENYNGLYYVVNILASKFFIRKGEPLKVAEIGCNSGTLSMYFAPLLKAFDPEAEFVCVSNAIGNESGVEWIDRISLVDAPSGLSYLVSDFQKTKLRDEYFDLTLINGTQVFSAPLEIVREAARITAEDGMIICISDDQELLDDGFRLLTDERKEYRFNDRRVVYAAKKKNFLNTKRRPDEHI